VSGLLELSRNQVPSRNARYCEIWAVAGSIRSIRILERAQRPAVWTGPGSRKPARRSDGKSRLGATLSFSVSSGSWRPDEADWWPPSRLRSRPVYRSSRQFRRATRHPGTPSRENWPPSRLRMQRHSMPGGRRCSTIAIESVRTPVPSGRSALAPATSERTKFLVQSAVRTYRQLSNVLLAV
jgi:hypothetical protein